MVAKFNYDIDQSIQHILRSSGKRAATMAAPPTVTVGTATSTLNGNTGGAVTHGFTGSTDNAPVTASDALAVVGTEMVRNGSSGGVVTARGGSVGYGPARRANIARLRFTVDEDFEICLFGLSTPIEDATLSIKIDGEYVARALAVPLIRTNTAQNILVSFGSNVATFGLNAASVAAGGTGYAVGDEVSTAGGAGTQARLVVQTVSSGAVTAVAIKSRGSFSSRPSAPVATTAVTGSGTGLTLSLPSSAWSLLHTTRKARLVEIIVNRGAVINGINVAATATVRPAPVAGPRVMFLGDSITERFFVDYPGGQWAAQCAERLGLEDYWLSGVQGTGWIAVNGSSVALIDRLATDVYPYQPDIVVTRMGFNDNGSTALAITAAVTATYEAMFANLPNALFIEMNAFRGGNNTPVAARLNAIRDGFLAAQSGSDLVGGVSVPRASRSLYIDGPAWETGTGFATGATGSGSSDHYINSDAIHPSQAGHDREGHLASLAIRAALSDFSMP